MVEEVLDHLEGLCFFKHKISGWLLLYQDLVVESKVDKIDITNSTCTLCGKDKTIQFVFWKCKIARVF